MIDIDTNYNLIIKEISENNIDILPLVSEKIFIKKNDIYLEQNKYSNKVFYILSGIIRGYHTNSEGEEKTVFFRSEREFGGDPECFLRQQPAKFTWMALEDTEIIEINFELYKKLIDNDIKLLNQKINIYQNLLYRMFERLEDFIFCSPEQRFKKLINTDKDLCNRIPDKYLASYLGITPVSFSRIKKRLKS